MIFCYSESSKGWVLGPGESIYYTWDNPLGVRMLSWSCGKNRDVKNDLVTVCPKISYKHFRFR